MGVDLFFTIWSVLVLISFIAILFLCSRIVAYLFFGRVLQNLTTYVNDLWISYSIREVSHLLTVNGLKAEDIYQLREQFIKEVYISLSRRYKRFLLLYFSREGLLTYIGKAFDKKILPLLSTQEPTQSEDKE